ATPTADRGHLAAQIQSLTAAGETALYDAVTHAVDQFSPGVTDRAVVLLSDGGDTASEATLTQAIGAVSDVRVNVIDLVTAESNRTALERLAAAGGGTVSSATDPAGLAELYRATASDLVNRYRMTWTSAAHGPVTLTVRLTTAGGVLEGTTRVEMPAAPVADDRADADAEAPAPATGAPGAADSGDETFVARWGLPAGAAAVFVALVLLGIALLPDERRARIERLRVHPGGPPARPERSVSAVTQRLV